MFLGIVVANNTASFAPGVDRNSTFVGNWSKEPVQIMGNRLAAGMKITDVR